MLITKLAEMIKECNSIVFLEEREFPLKVV